MGKTIDNKSTIDEYSQYIGKLKPEVSFWQGRKYVDQKTNEKYTLSELVKRLESVVNIGKLSPLETLKTEHAVEKLKKMDLEGARQLEKNLLINKLKEVEGNPARECILLERIGITFKEIKNKWMLKNPYFQEMNLRTNSSASNPKYPELKLNIPF